MARTADTEARRRQVAEALLRVIARDGLAGAKLASVAAEAGVSIGLVQSYFRSKDELLRFGIEHMCTRALERIAETPHGQTVRETLLSVMDTLLPLDEDRRHELAVWLAFLPTTLIDPEMRRIHQANSRQLLDALAAGFAHAQEIGELDERRDPHDEAAALAAFTDGLAVHHLATGDDFDRDRIQRLLTNHLDRVFSEGTRTP
ncbi:MULTISPECIES: TetR/AcrR family transcriptional regulator [Actinoalloteichus]|uniref:Transcriptional regulator, TetR family n=1 Tax=Actinoalloteichus fjordicus TaxID=1612552 RepID=A0AAC9LED3_9PSEU|nr:MULTISPECIES: TetR/AcrR family transcriptional regulator [Actinoalloteichus]APU16111.1 transcriptional regulator, TetR family [Actinoalloteichus fjordicus]APU22176.1 transcriptional regulator, TetR family [Actinoalloteichus sp. GBA129-24]